MKSDDPLREEPHPITTHSTQQRATPPPPRTRARSSGRGLYITSIVLGVIIFVLLVLYIVLSFTVKRPTHGVAIPINDLATHLARFVAW